MTRCAQYNAIQYSCLLFILTLFSAWGTASTSDTITVLQGQYDKIKDSAITAIKSVPDHPDLLESGSLKATLESVVSGDLASLRNRVQQQTRNMDYNKHSLETNSVLSETDKEELKAYQIRTRNWLLNLVRKLQDSMKP